MTTVGVKRLKDHLSEYLRRVRDGEAILITDRGSPVAMLQPTGAAAGPEDEEGRLWDLVREDRLLWGGGKPAGSPRPPRVRGRKTVARRVLEDRR